MIRASGIVAVSLLLAACAGGARLVPVLDRHNPGDGASPEWVTVRKGDTLYSVSFENGHDFKRIAAINGIKPPYTIYPGQRIRLKTDSGANAAAKPAAKAKPAAAKKPAPKKPPRKAKPARPSSPVKWQWPTRGKVARAYSAAAPRKKGIGIGGERGQTINAAATGKVVYSGNGLIGYGNLIIVKHNETYLSAYAYNSEVHVKEGQRVKRGEKIARMGANENDAPMLHFEIRKNGRPVNPLGYLPRR